jgi:hypothetical protein
MWCISIACFRYTVKVGTVGGSHRTVHRKLVMIWENVNLFSVW